MNAIGYAILVFTITHFGLGYLSGFNKYYGWTILTISFLFALSTLFIMWR